MKMFDWLKQNNPFKSKKKTGLPAGNAAQGDKDASPLDPSAKQQLPVWDLGDPQQRNQLGDLVKKAKKVQLVMGAKDFQEQGLSHLLPTNEPNNEP